MRGLGRELADEPDLGLQGLIEALSHRLLGVRDECAHVGGGRATEVHDDVRVDVRDLRATDAESLESALVDEPSRPDALDLLEGRARARMNLEPRMP